MNKKRIRSDSRQPEERGGVAQQDEGEHRGAKLLLLRDPPLQGLHVEVIEPEGFKPPAPRAVWGLTSGSTHQPILDLAVDKPEYKSFLWTPTSSDFVHYDTSWVGATGDTSLLRLEAQIFLNLGTVFYTLAYSYHQAGPRLINSSTSVYPEYVPVLDWQVIDGGGVHAIWSARHNFVFQNVVDGHAGVLNPQPLKSVTATPETVLAEANKLVASLPRSFLAYAV